MFGIYSTVKHECEWQVPSWINSTNFCAPSKNIPASSFGKINQIFYMANAIKSELNIIVKMLLKSSFRY